MKKEDIPEIAQKALTRILDRYGEVIYSSHETLKKGDVYLLGFNPGGNGFITIGDHIEKMLTRTKNSFLHENWKEQQDESINLTPEQKSPLQKRVHKLLNELGYKTEDVCASNLIFQTSTSSDKVCFGLAGLCWPVHEAIIELVRPKVLLTYGNSATSPYAFIKALFGHSTEEIQPIPAGHGNWKCKGFHTEINGNRLFVAGLPHLSYYDPTGKVAMIDWLKTNISHCK